MNSTGYAFKVLDMDRLYAGEPRGDPDVKYIGQAPHVVALPDGRLSKRLSGTRALCATPIKPQRVDGR